MNEYWMKDDSFKFFRVIIGNEDNEEYEDFDTREEALEFAKKNQNAAKVLGLPNFDPDDYGLEWDEEEVCVSEKDGPISGEELKMKKIFRKEKYIVDILNEMINTKKYSVLKSVKKSISPNG